MSTVYLPTQVCVCVCVSVLWIWLPIVARFSFTIWKSPKWIWITFDRQCIANSLSKLIHPKGAARLHVCVCCLSCGFWKVYRYGVSVAVRTMSLCSDVIKSNPHLTDGIGSWNGRECSEWITTQINGGASVCVCTSLLMLIGYSLGNKLLN